MWHFHLLILLLSVSDTFTHLIHSTLYLSGTLAYACRAVDVGVTDCNRKIALIKTVVHTDKSRLGLDATVAHFDKLF